MGGAKRGVKVMARGSSPVAGGGRRDLWDSGPQSGLPSGCRGLSNLEKTHTHAGFNKDE